MPCTTIQSSLKTFDRYGRPPSGRITSTVLDGSSSARDDQRGVQRDAARAAGEDALLARQPARGVERVAVADRDQAVDRGAVEGRRPEVLADALDEIGVHLRRWSRSSPRVGADDLDAGLALPEVAPDARDGAARADAEHEHVELVAELLPDLRARALVVRLGVGGIGVLVRVERARRLLGQAARDRVVGARILRLDLGRADHDLGAEGAQQRDLLARILSGITKMQW